MVFTTGIYSSLLSSVLSSGKNKKEGRLFLETYVVVDDEEKKHSLVCLPSHDSPVIWDKERGLLTLHL